MYVLAINNPSSLSAERLRIRECPVLLVTKQMWTAHLTDAHPEVEKCPFDILGCTDHPSSRAKANNHVNTLHAGELYCLTDGRDEFRGVSISKCEETRTAFATSESCSEEIHRYENDSPDAYQECPACNSLYQLLPFKIHILDYHGIRVRNKQTRATLPTYTAKFTYAGSTLPISLLAPTVTMQPTSITFTFRTSNIPTSKATKSLYSADVLQMHSEKSASRLRDVMGWTGPISTQGLFLPNVCSKLFPVATKKRLDRANERFKYRLVQSVAQKYPVYTTQLKAMIQNGGDTPVLLCNWDGLTTKFQLFEEFARTTPDFTLCLHSKKRLYEVQRDGALY